MNLLNKIIEHKKLEVESARKSLSVNELVDQPLFERECRSLRSSIEFGSGIIAEFKRKSPSAGKIQENAVDEVLQFYQSNSVSAFSVLTDEHFFGGTVQDLESAYKAVEGPILRKEFIIDEYQLFEAKAFGADAVLLIAEVLDEYYATHLGAIAHSLGLEVLMEFHSPAALNRLNEYVDVIGVNNRNLDTLEVDLATSKNMIKYLPYEKVKITESGIRSREELKRLYSLGYQGCLIGESVLKSPNLLTDLTEVAQRSKSVKA